jgi:Mn2+/Fe2+ NRAMP family transporter
MIDNYFALNQHKKIAFSILFIANFFSVYTQNYSLFEISLLWTAILGCCFVFNWMIQEQDQTKKIFDFIGFYFVMTVLAFADLCGYLYRKADLLPENYGSSDLITHMQVAGFVNYSVMITAAIVLYKMYKSKDNLDIFSQKRTNNVNA